MRTKSARVVTALLSFGLVAGVPLAAASDEGASPGSSAGETQAVRPAPLAGAAVTLGEVKAAQGPCGTGSPFGVTSGLEDPTRPGYVAPFSGVLTSFSTYSGATGGSVQALVLTNGADATHKVVAAKSPDYPVPANSLSSWSTRLPIKAGERIGLGFSTTGMACSSAPRPRTAPGSRIPSTPTQRPTSPTRDWSRP